MIAKNDIHKVKHMLLRNFLNPNAHDLVSAQGKTITPLHLAVDRNHFEMVKLLTQHGANIRAFEFAAVLNAIKHGKIQILKYFIEKCELDLNEITPKRNTPLIFHAAALNSNLETIKFFIAHGCDTNILIRDATDLFNWVLDNGEGNKQKFPTYNKSMHGNGFKHWQKLAEYLLKNGADLHSINHITKKPPLIRACYFDQKQLFNFLLENGANLFANDYGALFTAISKNNFEIAIALIEYGCIVTDENILTPTIVATLQNEINAKIKSILPIKNCIHEYFLNIEIEVPNLICSFCFGLPNLKIFFDTMQT